MTSYPQILWTAFCDGFIFAIINIIANIAKLKPKHISPPLQNVIGWSILLLGKNEILFVWHSWLTKISMIWIYFIDLLSTQFFFPCINVTFFEHVYSKSICKVKSNHLGALKILSLLSLFCYLNKIINK